MKAPIVEFDSGRVRGRYIAGVLRFDGIPYAQPPTGPNRFEPPRSMEPWSGIRDATTPRPAPLQLPGAALGSRPVGASSEDCLHLNVVTPSLTGSRAVLVWIYGGGFVNGSAADPIHTGERLVAATDVVLVTFDYRLGVMGFLHSDHASNLGIRDQVAALEWVRRNIHAFGGDPDRVTLFGESAGAMCLLTLMGVPAADHLFRAGIVQSGATSPIASKEDAERTRHAFAATVGSADPGVWRTLPAETLLAAQQQVDRQIRSETGRGAFRPLLDADLIECDGLEAQQRDCNRRRPLILGSNGDEQRLFMGLRRRLERGAAIRRLGRALRRHVTDPEEAAAQILEGYAALHPDLGELERLAAAETELYYRLPLLRLAARRHQHGGQSWNYLFTWQSPALRGRLGACHALEIPFVFGTLDAPGMARFAGDGDAAWALSQRMMAAWGCFARDHDPRGTVAGWHPWEPEQRLAWQADRESRVVARPREAERELIRGVVPEWVA